jgi:hypothetical protein
MEGFAKIGKETTAGANSASVVVLGKEKSPMKKSPLTHLKVAAPCQAEWKWMWGTEKVRFCGQCHLNVYNLSAMTTEQAEDLIRRTEGQLCVRFYRRKDGTVLTQNCPVGIQAFRAKLRATRTHVIASILSFFGYFGSLWLTEREPVQPSMLMNAAVPPVMGTVFSGTDVEMGKMVRTPLVKRGERYIRERAMFKVTPVFHLAVPAYGASQQVVVNITISTDGKVTKATSVAGPSSIREMAEEAAYGWKFQLMKKRDRPAMIESKLTFHFGR